VEYNPGLKAGERVGENALLNFISTHMPRRKDLNIVEQTVENNNRVKDNKGFDPLVIDRGRTKRSDNRHTVPMESKIRKNIINMVRGELLKEEMDKGKRFYRMFSKAVFGDPKDSKGNPVN
jgi:hypothetical protein